METVNDIFDPLLSLEEQCASTPHFHHVISYRLIANHRISPVTMTRVTMKVSAMAKEPVWLKDVYSAWRKDSTNSSS